jgi:hypothetical protein
MKQPEAANGTFLKIDYTDGDSNVAVMLFLGRSAQFYLHSRPIAEQTEGIALVAALEARGAVKQDCLTAEKKVIPAVQIYDATGEFRLGFRYHTAGQLQNPQPEYAAWQDFDPFTHKCRLLKHYDANTLHDTPGGEFAVQRFDSQGKRMMGASSYKHGKLLREYNIEDCAAYYAFKVLAESEHAERPLPPLPHMLQPYARPSLTLPKLGRR